VLKYAIWRGFPPWSNKQSVDLTATLRQHIGAPVMGGDGSRAGPPVTGGNYTVPLHGMYLVEGGWCVWAWWV
jgi:hypothetical protein